MSVPALADPATEPRTRDELRWRRRSLAALLLLVPLALAVASYESLRSLLRSEDLFARDVAWGSAAAFGGSKWRLVELKGGKDFAGLPPGAVAVEADFEVMVGDADLENRWSRCKVMLVDTEGHTWLPASIAGLRLPEGMMGCNSAMFSGAKSGDVLKLGETFIVPGYATSGIRAAVGLGSERPYYLRFARPSA